MRQTNRSIPLRPPGHLRPRGWCQPRYTSPRSVSMPAAALLVSQVPTGTLSVADPSGPDKSSTNSRASRRTKIHFAWLGPAFTPRLLAQATVVGLVLLLGACAPAANDLVDIANTAGLVAGFWRGLWHGIIAPATFLISLFTDRVSLYEVHNNGGWYNLGFVIGMLSFHGKGAVRVAARRRRNPVAVTVHLTS